MNPVAIPVKEAYLYCFDFLFVVILRVQETHGIFRSRIPGWARGSLPCSAASVNHRTASL
jgi:hypothetical protein